MTASIRPTPLTTAFTLARLAVAVGIVGAIGIGAAGQAKADCDPLMQAMTPQPILSCQPPPAAPVASDAPPPAAPDALPPDAQPAAAPAGAPAAIPPLAAEGAPPSH
jgi:hypothetical protein